MLSEFYSKCWTIFAILEILPNFALKGNFYNYLMTDELIIFRGFNNPTLHLKKWRFNSTLSEFYSKWWAIFAFSEISISFTLKGDFKNSADDIWIIFRGFNHPLPTHFSMQGVSIS